MRLTRFRRPWVTRRTLPIDTVFTVTNDDNIVYLGDSVLSSYLYRLVAFNFFARCHYSS